MFCGHRAYMSHTTLRAFGVIPDFEKELGITKMAFHLEENDICTSIYVDSRSFLLSLIGSSW